MGKLNHEPHIHHFSHHHPLELNYNNNDQITTCSACKCPPYDYMYSCIPCNFTLHLICTKFPQSITHPSHPTHSLSLLPMSAYPGGIFNCDACNRRSNGFSYHCDFCDFDLHVDCASKPLLISHQAHPHPISLTFTNPYLKKGFSCDICYKIGHKQWLYRCGECEFDAHLECATGGVPLPPKLVAHQPPPQLQLAKPHHHHHHSILGTSSGGNVPPVGVGFMNAVLQEGFVGGGAQEAGQNLVQSSINGDGNDNNYGNGDLPSVSLYEGVEMSNSATDYSFESQDY